MSEPHARPAKPPLRYFPPVNQWTPQTGMGTVDMRFTDRKYEKGQETRPPNFYAKGSTPMRAKSSYPRAHDCSKFPEYKEDPWDDKIKAERARTAKERALIERPFKPAGNKPGPAFQARFTARPHLIHAQRTMLEPPRCAIGRTLWLRLLCPAEGARQ